MQANNNEHDDLLDPPGADTAEEEVITSYTAPQMAISDNDLDSLILQLHCYYRRAGISMLQSMLLRLGYQIPQEWIWQSLI